MDNLEVGYYSTYAQVLLKYLPGYAAPLQADLDSATFPFDPIRFEGTFETTYLDRTNFADAVGEVNPLLLVAKTTPLVIRILASSQCPIKPLGAVNTKNVFRIYQPQLCVVATTDLSYVATFGAVPGQRRKQGVEFIITIDVRKGGELVLSMDLSYLQFLPSNHKPLFVGGQQDRQNRPRDVTGEVVGSVDLTPSDPPRWAKCCQDHNPIHVSPIGARLFGFKSVIAHGNHVVAMVMQRLKLQDELSTPCSVEAEFLRPVFLPGTFAINKVSDNSTWVVQREGSSKPQMRVSIDPISKS